MMFIAAYLNKDQWVNRRPGYGEYGVSHIDLGIQISEYKELTAGRSGYGVSHLDSERTHLTRIMDYSCFSKSSSRTDDLVQNTSFIYKFSE